MTRTFLFVFSALTFIATSLWAEPQDDAGFHYQDEHLIYSCNPERERC